MQKQFGGQPPCFSFGLYGRKEIELSLKIPLSLFTKQSLMLFGLCSPGLDILGMWTSPLLGCFYIELTTTPRFSLFKGDALALFSLLFPFSFGLLGPLVYSLYTVFAQ